MKTKSLVFKNIFDSLSLLTNKEKKNLFLITIAASLSSLIEVVSLMSVYPFLQILFDPEVLKTNDKFLFSWNLLGSPSYENYIFVLGTLVSIGLIISSFITFFIQSINNRFAAKCQERIGFDLFRLILFADYEWHIVHNSTLLMTLFVSHLAIWSRSIIRQVPIVIGNLSLIIIPSFSLLLLAPKTGFLLILLFSAIVLIFLRYVRKKTDSLSKISKFNQDEVTAFVIELFQGIKDVKLSSQEALFFKRFKRTYHNCCMTYSSINTWNQVPTSFIALISQLAIIIIGTFMVFYKFSPENILSIMAIVILLASRIIPAINRLGNSLIGISNRGAWIKTLKDIYTSVNKYKSHKKIKFKTEANWKNLKFENVSYSYPYSSRIVINKTEFNIKNGNYYAFVGLSGSGKSTIIDLILGLLIPKSGIIKIDNISLKKFGIKKWQSHIGYVPQKPLINDFSLRENIAYGIDKELIDENQIKKCIQLAALEELVSSLPKGLDSKLGERGKLISGGQQQRVAIARALYDNPKILIFDEATSSLDAKNENFIKESINKLKGKITIISISHRFYTIRNCDHIFVVENGQIREQGNYEELSRKSKYFREIEGSIDN